MVNTRSFARAVEFGIHYEAMCRAVLDTELAIGAGLLGTRTTAQRRRRRERDDAIALRGHGETRGARPLVNWHEGGDGPALLLLNGWTASGLLWPLDWLAQLESSYRVIRVDNRGTGWSRCAPAPFTMADLADDAATVLRACGIERATVLGLSMGGMIAQELALRHPDRVERLILVGTRPPSPAQIDPDPTPMLAALRPPEGDLRDYIAEMWTSYACPDFAAANPAAMDELVTQVLDRVTPRQRVFDQMRAIAAWRGPQRLRRLRVPTTIVHGSGDPLMPVGNGMRLTRLIRDANYVELAGVGHLVPYEAGADLVALLEPAQASRRLRTI
ncbi:MAG TPA: alpha/beta hydrolase [Aldersonia sp.]